MSQVKAYQALEALAAATKEDFSDVSRRGIHWVKGKFAGNHGFPHEIWGFPVNFPLNQSIEIHDLLSAFPLRLGQ